MSDPALPVRVPLVTEPWGILKSLSAARRNVLSILPEIATRQPMVSGKTGKRWHMVMDPGA
ncbi:MAG: cytochrome P450, partial [Rhodobacteraceae bacterium]|nr:cytochrome P450 [Paracoccaceae bacterium]